MTLPELFALDPRTIRHPAPECVDCKNPISGVHPDNVRMTADGPVHDDCYVKADGALAEEGTIRGSGRS